MHCDRSCHVTFILLVFSLSVLFYACDGAVDQQIGYGPPPENARFCVAVEADRFQCTNNPNTLREQLEIDFRVLMKMDLTGKNSKYQNGLEVGPGEIVSTGVPQRIDGTEAEQNAIKDVLKRMNEYFYNEILSLPEYEFMRQRWYVTGKIDGRRPFHRFFDS